jgi:hypothetical protein
MIVLETEHGRFEAATQREALAAARKARKAVDALQKRRDADRGLAYLRAERNGYRILRWKAQGDSPRGFVARPGEPCGPALHVASNSSKAWQQATYETAEGRVTIDHPGYRVLAVASDAGGFTVAVFLQDDSGRREAYALGVAGDQWAFADLPGVGMDDWKEARS